jgi:acyl carrier protein
MAMLPDEGVHVFERILSLRMLDQVVVSCGDLDTRIGQWIRLESVRRGPTLGQAAGRAGHERPDLPNAYVEPETESEIKLAAIWRDLFGYQQIGTRDGFFELGGHSLLAIQMLARIREAFDVNLPLVSLFEHPTIETLSLHIDAAAWASVGPAAEHGSSAEREEITL